MDDSASMATPAHIVVTFDPNANAARERAVALSAELDRPMYEPDAVPLDALQLVVTARRLELRGPGGSKVGPVFVDFVGGTSRERRVRPGAGKELIARAVGLKGEPLSILDATAGFARDAFVLAQLGCRVCAIERSPIVAALVEDGIARAAGRTRVVEALDRLTFVCGDACGILADFDRQPDCLPNRSEPQASACANFQRPSHPTAGWHGQAQRRHARSAEHGGQPQPISDSVGRCPLGDFPSPDVVYLDPMYPASRKSALNRKELRMLRSIVGDDPDAGELLAVAHRVARMRVVVKRPRHAPPLAPNPDVQYKGTSVRYDVYLTRTSPEGGVRE